MPQHTYSYHPVTCQTLLIVYNDYFPDDDWLTQPKHVAGYVNKVHYVVGDKQRLRDANLFSDVSLCADSF
jgi:hypothetical protein